MRKAILAVVTMLFALPALAQFDAPFFQAPVAAKVASGATWTLVHGNDAGTYEACASFPCSTGTLSPAVVAGHAEIILISASAANTSTSPYLGASVSGDTLTECSGFPQTAGTNPYFFSVDCYEQMSATGGATSFSVTPSWASGSYYEGLSIQFLEVSKSSGTAVIDALNVITSNVATSSPWPTLSLSGTNDYCFLWSSGDSQPSGGLGSPWTNPAEVDTTNWVTIFGALDVTSYSPPNLTTNIAGTLAQGAGCLK